MKKKRKNYILFTLALVISVCGNSYAILIENRFMVTDVTPVQYCVIWATTEPAAPSVEVFLDANATMPYTEATIISDSSKHPPAEDIGVMKVRVMGLTPDSSYFFRIKL